MAMDKCWKNRWIWRKFRLFYNFTEMVIPGINMLELRKMEEKVDAKPKTDQTYKYKVGDHVNFFNLL